MTLIACVGAAVLLSANSTAIDRIVPRAAPYERSGDGRIRNLRDWFKDRGSKDEARKSDAPLAPVRSANSQAHESRSLLGRWYTKRRSQSTNSHQASVPTDRTEPPAPPAERHLSANMFRSTFRTENPNQLVPMHPAESPNGISAVNRRLSSPSGPTRATESNQQVSASRPVASGAVHDQNQTLVRANVSDDSDSLELEVIPRNGAAAGIEQKLRVAGQNRGAALNRTAITDPPSRLPALLAQEEQRISQQQLENRVPQTRIAEYRVAEAQYLSEHNGSAAVANAATSPDQHVGAAAVTDHESPKQIDIRAAVLSLPTHWYLSIIITCTMALALSLANRHPSRSVGDVSLPGGFISIPAVWPISIAPDRQAARAATTVLPSAIVGTVVTVLGMGIAVLGISVLFREFQTGEPALRRPGLMIGAAGQLVVLIGIAIQILSRTSRSVQAGGAVASAATMPLAAVHPSLVSASPSMANCAVSSELSDQPAQIAKLKAQVAVLTERVEHLAK